MPITNDEIGDDWVLISEKILHQRLVCADAFALGFLELDTVG